jgi:hypothetical protein
VRVGDTVPHGVDEFIVDVLLGIVDYTLDIPFEVIDESPEPNRVVLGQVVVASAECCMNVFDEELDDPTVIKIRNRHSDEVRLPDVSAAAALDASP